MLVLCKCVCSALAFKRPSSRKGTGSRCHELVKADADAQSGRTKGGVLSQGSTLQRATLRPAGASS